MKRYAAVTCRDDILVRAGRSSEAMSSTIESVGRAGGRYSDGVPIVIIYFSFFNVLVGNCHRTRLLRG